MLELSGEIADGVITHGIAPSHLAFARLRVTAGAAKVGRPADACNLCLMFDYEYDQDRGTALEQMRDRCAFMIGGSYAEELIPIYGLDPDQVLPIRRAVSDGDRGRATRLMTHEMIEAFAVGGSENVLAQRLSDLTAAGVGSVILSLGGNSVDDTVTRIQRVGRVLAG
jgi:5,10-methylenetetrahydromethanopterin reductase